MFTGCALSPEQAAELAQPHTGPAVRRAQDAARHYGMALVLPFAERDGTGIYDTIVVVAPTGALLSAYRRSHLYGAAELETCTAERELPPLVPLNGVSVGLLNCYECEFPPL